MQIDFHYCMVRLLSEKAGFTPDEAQNYKNLLFMLIMIFPQFHQTFTH